MRGTGNRVLVVEGDDRARQRYRGYLERHHDVSTAPDGETALDRVDEGCGTDIVVLSRSLPGLSGEYVAAALRHRNDAPMVAMLSDTSPGTEILGLACDEYLTRPVSGDDLLDAVDRLAQRARYDARLAEYATLATKCGRVEAAGVADLSSDPDYRALCDRIRTLQSEVDDLVLEFDSEDFAVAFRHPDFAAEERSYLS